ncbi:hypothetical protein PLICRDRAFT_47327 [Plicaturopsis crispa FD-325 SS-3]|uniref:Uncharacterized protein n=1 Tax=Plicaturopsis crispa FD-325 SS-3 TaxID=944288 RepID=A0A0C9T244_PLICR|nr:hypothetical protein PLICRDRAFT_47327 [Plicaturopsis crispa FD-325 SS-3]
MAVVINTPRRIGVRDHPTASSVADTFPAFPIRRRICERDKSDQGLRDTCMMCRHCFRPHRAKEGMSPPSVWTSTVCLVALTGLWMVCNARKWSRSIVFKQVPVSSSTCAIFLSCDEPRKKRIHWARIPILIAR